MSRETITEIGGLRFGPGPQPSIEDRPRIEATIYRKGRNRSGLWIHGPVVVLRMVDGEREMSMQFPHVMFAKMMRDLGSVAKKKPRDEDAPWVEPEP